MLTNKMLLLLGYLMIQQKKREARAQKGRSTKYTSDEERNKAIKEQQNKYKERHVKQ